MLLSLELFSNCFETEPCTLYQISARYSHLSSIFQGLHMTEEACLALCFAIKYQILESLPLCKDKDEHIIRVGSSDILMLCHEHVFGKIRCPMTYWGRNNHMSRVQPLVDRLVRLYAKRYWCKLEVKRYTYDIPKEIHAKVNFLTTIEYICTSEKLLSLEYMFGHIILQHEIIGRNLPMIIGTCHEMVDAIGKILDDCLQNNASLLFKDFEGILSLSNNMLFEVTSNSIGHRRENAAALYVTAASALSPAKQRGSLLFIHNHFEYLKLSEKRLISLDMNPTQQVKFLVYKASVLYSLEQITEKYEVVQENNEIVTNNSSLLSTLSYFTPYKKVLSMCSEAVTLMNNNNEIRWKEVLPEKFILYLISIITKVYVNLDFEGSSLVAAQYFLQLRQLVIDDPLLNDTTGFDSIAGRVFLGGELNDTVSLIVLDHKETNKLRDVFVENVEYLIGEIKEIDVLKINHKSSDFQHLMKQLLLHSTEIQAYSHAINSHNLSSVVAALHLIVERDQTFLYEVCILEDTLECASIIFYLTCQWWKTTLLLILSETYERCGDVINALHFVRICSKLSKDILNVVRRCRISFKKKLSEFVPFEFGLLSSTDLSTFVLPLVGRITHCFLIQARLYSRLGNYKKAQIYAVSSMNSLFVVPNENKISLKSTLTDILNDVKVTTIHQRKCCRMLMIIIMQSMRIDEVNDKLVSIIESHLLRISNFFIEKLKDSEPGTLMEHLDWVRESVLDLVTCKFIYLGILCSKSFSLNHSYCLPNYF